MGYLLVKVPGIFLSQTTRRFWPQNYKTTKKKKQKISFFSPFLYLFFRPKNNHIFTRKPLRKRIRVSGFCNFQSAALSFGFCMIP